MDPVQSEGPWTPGPCFVLTLQKTLYFLVSQRNIELKTGKHEFTDISDQNKQGFESKKLSGTELIAFE